MTLDISVRYNINNNQEKEENLMKTKILSLILAFSFVLSAPMSAFAATAPITPVSPISAIEVTVPEEATTWLAGSVEIALKHDLIPEALQSKYNQPLTRGEFTTLVARLYEKITGEEIKERKTFADTKSADIEKVAGLGILSGVGNGKFNPDAMITREQAAVVIKRLLDKLDYKFYLNPEYQWEFEEFIKEYPSSVSSWAVEVMAQLCYEDIGYGFWPYDDSKAGITLEESLYVLMRVFRLTNNNLLEGYTDAQAEAKKILNTFKTKYPTGTPWGYEKEYPWVRYRNFKAKACSAFASELSDAVFGDLPVYSHSDFEAIKIGDILLVNDSGHAVIVVDITEKGVVVAEGNFNGKVRWGATYTKEQFVRTNGTVLTRYPEVYPLTQ